MASPAPNSLSSKSPSGDTFMSQRAGLLSRRRGAPKKKKKVGGKKGAASPRSSEEPASSSRSFVASPYDLDADALHEEMLARDLEIADLRGRLHDEELRTDRMEKTAEVALRALDAG